MLPLPVLDSLTSPMRLLQTRNREQLLAHVAKICGQFIYIFTVRVIPTTVRRLVSDAL